MTVKELKEMLEEFPDDMEVKYGIGFDVSGVEMSEDHSCVEHAFIH